MQLLSSEVLAESWADMGLPGVPEDTLRKTCNAGEVHPGWFLDFMNHSEGTTAILTHLDGKTYGIIANTLGESIPNRSEAREGILKFVVELIDDDSAEVRRADETIRGDDGPCS